MHRPVSAISEKSFVNLPEYPEQERIVAIYRFLVQKNPIQSES